MLIEYTERPLLWKTRGMCNAWTCKSSSSVINLSSGWLWAAPLTSLILCLYLENNWWCLTSGLIWGLEKTAYWKHVASHATCSHTENAQSWRQLSQRQGSKDRWCWLELSKHGSHAARPSPTRIMAKISQQVWPHTEHRLLSQRERTFEALPFPPAMGGRTKPKLCTTMEFQSEAESCWLEPSRTCYRLLRYRVWLSVPLLQRPELHT